MGQKINPIGLRLGINRGWDSLGLLKRKILKIFDRRFKIRKYIKKILQIPSLRNYNREVFKKCTVSIHTSRPGFVIGKKGADIEKLKKTL